MEEKKIINYLRKNSISFNVYEYIYTFKDISENKITKTFYSKNKNNPNLSVINIYLKRKILSINKYHKVLDLCTSPGLNSLSLFNLKPNLKIYGLSLPPEKGGYTILKKLEENKNFYFNYFDLLTDNEKNIDFKIDKVELAIFDCFINHNKNRSIKNTFNLYGKALKLILKKLKKEGDLYMVFSFRSNFHLLLSTIKILEFFFEEIIYEKITHKFSLNTTVIYIVAKNYNSKKIPKILEDYSNGDIKIENNFIDDNIININKILNTTINNQLKLVSN